MKASNFFHICAAYVRSPQEENYNNCIDISLNTTKGERGKGIYTYNGLPTMDIIGWTVQRTAVTERQR